MLPESATPEQIAALREDLGLSDPLPQQYVRFLQDTLTGDLGQSTWTGRPVSDVIQEALPKTLVLAMTTITLAVLVSITLALWAVSSRNRIVGGAVSMLSFAAVSLPEFWFGLILVSIFAIQWDLFPTGGHGGWTFMVLPVATLMVRSVGRLSHTTRRSLQEAMRQDYALHALGDGLPRKMVLRRHALPNSLLSLFTLAGDELTQLVSGAVVVETIFAWPGVGYLTISGIRNRDPYLVVGLVLVIAALVLLINLIVDLLYAAANPRMRGSMAES
jgi:peptide/nickel transport system permease protein